MSGPCQGPAGKTGVTKEIVKGVDRVVYLNPEELEEVSVRWGGNEYKHNSSDPYHKLSPVDDPEAPNDFLDCPAKDPLGDEGDDVEGMAVGPGRDGSADRRRQARRMRGRKTVMAEDGIKQYMCTRDDTEPVRT